MVLPYFYSMHFYTKNMVCNRCITAVRREFEAAGIQPVNITLGEVETAHKDYSYISALFSEVEGITIEKYIIRQKTEKVKELLTYDEMSLSAIALQLGYSSVAHLTEQFKKVTGLTPSHFRQAGIDNRKTLDKI